MSKNSHPLLKKGAYFSDIHFGKKANSHLHNEDCMNYITWFCENVQDDPEIDHIVFMGDWFENRSAINIATMKVAYLAAKKLNDLGLPVYFIIGNHDLYHRHTRETHSLMAYHEFDNFEIIEELTIKDNVHGGLLLCPFLFHQEYPQLKKHKKINTWAGHFEFRGFVVTGADMRMPTGPEAKDYVGPDFIFSGHFHKRQIQEHVIYIGNTFPMDYGDAGDFNRGMMVYDYIEKEPVFYDWVECPKYIKTTLSDIIDKSVQLVEQARVRCVVDIPISFEEYSFLKDKFHDDYQLREITMEESPEIANALSETETTVDTNSLKSVNELVLQMLGEIKSDHIDNTVLTEEYNALKA